MKQKYLLETITPVHIGSGYTLNHTDGFYANGRWYQIDLDRVLNHPTTDLNALTSEMSRRDFRWQRYLSQSNLDPDQFAIYSMPCQQSPETGEVQEAIKTMGNQPYIPGSTLKGALRTALLSHSVDQDDKVFNEGLKHLSNLTNQQARGNPRRETPAKKIEQHAFGDNPNLDVFRALQVSDTEAIIGQSLEIGTAWTITLNKNDQLVQKINNGREYKIFVQQFQVKQQLTFTLKIDEQLFREQEKRRLNFNSQQQEMLTDIAEVCRTEVGVHMQDEQEFYDYYNFPNIPDVYDRLIHENDRLPEGAFILQIGWGTGYNANTITSSFTQSEDAPEELWLDLRKRFKLGESRSRRGQFDEREFPKTRRILYWGQNPTAPLGWVKISPVQD